ncbi:S-adenosyl-L-methionine-dependent methyltransferase [Dactylonectria estremocensis]|uniref:S-adenosyl-L-methionine-dependent methyltransferase n=1 Tax=Dactylonectria estremocensis TaxID=1079267 RepID=A0A9P9IVA6_9HYPO|nr:S-adenosyl-L-methionine-dependent methyltransferase [Dactylonectria estremocensis]
MYRCRASSTASISSSILEYRRFKGRTYHSDRHPTEYFTPNDEQQSDSIDINHHALTLLLGGKLFIAPIDDKVQKVIDIGCGTGIWAIEFADQYPEAEVIGSDLSPIQPSWVPPNVKFEIDDATLTWSWKDNTFDFVHIRYLFGAIRDWNSLFKEAYRCTAPGGWIQSAEADVEIRSDDGTTDSEEVLKTWATLYREGGKALGSPFYVTKENLQEKGIEAAGFTDIKSVEYKFPIGGWAKDENLREVGNFVQATLENDIEGYTLLLWHNVLKYPKDDYQMFLLALRKYLRNKKVHGYMTVRYVYGRKPGSPKDDES